MAAFEYRQAEEIRAGFERHGVRYLFIGKSGAILLGFPDTTQDAALFVEKTPASGRAIVDALREIGYDYRSNWASGQRKPGTTSAPSRLPAGATSSTDAGARCAAADFASGSMTQTSDTPASR